MTAIRCSRCNRPLTAVTVVQGGLAVGPTCAQRLGITAPKASARTTQPRSRAHAKQIGQMDLLEMKSHE